MLNLALSPITQPNTSPNGWAKLYPTPKKMKKVLAGWETKLNIHLTFFFSTKKEERLRDKL